MKKILLSLLVFVSYSFVSLETIAFSDEDLAEINENLEGLSVDELLERRDFLIAQLEIDEKSNLLVDCAGILGGTATIDEDGICNENPTEEKEDTNEETAESDISEKPIDTYAIFFS